MRVDDQPRLEALGLDRPIWLMTPDQIHARSGGEVRKPDTLNYRTLAPEKGGLFCEHIFGSKDSKDRLGHVDLGTPVRHAWLESETTITVLPVMPPGLRPMKQLSDNRWATTDVTDLYRRVINRNNRLKRLIELNAPEIIIDNEKRMLQEAVDSLFDNQNAEKRVKDPKGRLLVSLGEMKMSETLLECLCFTTSSDVDAL